MIATKKVQNSLSLSLTLENSDPTVNSALNKTESLKKATKTNNYIGFCKTKLASSEKLTYYKHLDRNYDMATYLSIIKKKA